MAAAPNLSSLNVVYRPRPAAQHRSSSIHPLLELSMAQTNSQGAYLYRLDRNPDGLELVSWSGRAVSDIERLSRKLADRKLFDRAKGLLQAGNQWTEEQAYLHLRRTSQQRRTPMRDIAREIIDLGASAPRGAQ